VQLTALRERIAASVCANALGGTRLDTLITDGFFPLLAAHFAAHAQQARDSQQAQSPANAANASETALFALWKNWPVGDMPAQYPKLLRTLEITGTRDTPLHNGAAQGVLGFLIDAEGR